MAIRLLFIHSILRGSRGEDAAFALSREPDTYWTDQLNNHDSLAESSGANIVAAIRVAERLGPRAKVVTLLADSGLKYLSTDVYRRRD